jgi:hypothetical protein
MSSRFDTLVSEYGEFWCRDRRNLAKMKETYGNAVGIYALYNGLTPVYFGQGYIASRLSKHAKHKLRGQYWDHFSWYRVEAKGS